MTYCGDISITPSRYEWLVIRFWRSRSEKYSTFAQAAFGYWTFVQKQTEHAELLNSFNRQPRLSDY